MSFQRLRWILRYLKTHRDDVLTDTAPHCQRGEAVSDLIQRAFPIECWVRLVRPPPSCSQRDKGSWKRIPLVKRLSPRTQWRLTLENLCLAPHKTREGRLQSRQSSEWNLTRRAFNRSHLWRGVNGGGGGTAGGGPPTYPLCITYTATQILTLFKQATPYPFKYVGLAPWAHIDDDGFALIDLNVFTR